MHRKLNRRTRIKLLLTVACSGGLLPAKCEVLWHDAFINGSKQTLASFFDPATILDLLDNSSGP